MRAILALLLSLLLAPAWAQVPMTGAGKGTPAAAVTYQGPGDIVSGATAWGSCARVYTVAQASTATSLCDLVAVTGGAAVCTLRGSSTGFVDLAASYCAGTDPASACAAASGGSCKVTKVYDQTGNGNHLTNGTLAQMPVLTFSALNGLPGMTYTSAAGAVTFLATGNLTISQPFSFSTVAKRTANNTTAQNAFGNSSTPYVGFSSSTNTVIVQGASGGATLAGQSDGSFHGMQGIVNGASSFVSSDGSDGSTASLTGTFSASPLRFGRAPQADAVIMEGGLWSSAFTSGGSGQAQAITANQRSSTSGYNF